jgi:tetratricopeptide (TPR) repeat protein
MPYRYFLVLLIAAGSCFSQDKKLDSLFSVLNNLGRDTVRVKCLNKIADKLMRAGEYDTSIYYCNEAKKLAELLSYKSGLAKSVTTLGMSYCALGHNQEGINQLQVALKLWKEIDNKESIAPVYGNIGNAYFDMGNYPLAIKNLLESLKILEKLNNRFLVAATYNNIGNIYRVQENYEEAFKKYDSCLKIGEAIKNDVLLASSYQNIGLIYYNKKQYDKAIEYYNRASEIAGRSGDAARVQGAMTNIALVHEKRGEELLRAGKKKEAFKEFNMSMEGQLEVLKLVEETGNKINIAGNLMNIGNLCYFMNKKKEAEDYFLRGVKIAEEVGHRQWMLNGYGNLSELYFTGGNFEKSLKYLKMQVAVNDSLGNEENTKEMVRLEMNYAFEKKQAAVKLEQEKRDAVADADRRRQLAIIWSVTGILLLVSGFAFFAYRAFLQKRKDNIKIIKQKEIIEEKQQEILDSIHYAKRIQAALLTSEVYIQRQLDKLLGKGNRA